jgi:hypothetical protein
MTLRADDGLRIRSSLTIEPNTTISGLSRTSLDVESLASFVIPLEQWRVWNTGAVLPNTSASDDLGYYSGTWGTDTAALKTYDVKTVGATTLYARTTVVLPPEYVATNAVSLRMSAGHLTAVADTTSTIDVDAYLSDDEAIISGSNLYSGAAQSCNSLTFANLDYTIDAGTLSPGNSIDVRLAVAVNDGAGASAVIACIGSTVLRCDIRG